MRCPKMYPTGKNYRTDEMLVLTMTDSHPTNQSHYGILREHIANHPICLTLIQSAPRPTCDDPACILSTVLQQQQTLTYLRRGVDSGIV